MSRITLKGKERRNYGKGENATYKPFITTSEFASRGTTAVIVDWKTRRAVHLLSQAELYFYLILRWDDNNVDIKEQYPMVNDKYIEAARSQGFIVKPKEGHIQTIDFLVTEASGKLHAYSVKSSRSLSDEALRKLVIEKAYWLYEGVEYTVLFKSDVESFVPHNIRQIISCYDEKDVFDEYTAILHKIARKELYFDVWSEPLTKAVIKRILKGV